MGRKTEFFVAILVFALLVSACAPAASLPASTAEPAESPADLSGIKTYLLDHTRALQATGLQIQEQADRYYSLAKDANFDYAAHGIIDSSSAGSFDGIPSFVYSIQPAV